MSDEKWEPQFALVFVCARSYLRIYTSSPLCCHQCIRTFCNDKADDLTSRASIIKKDQADSKQDSADLRESSRVSTIRHIKDTAVCKT